MEILHCMPFILLQHVCIYSINKILSSVHTDVRILINEMEHSFRRLALTE